MTLTTRARRTFLRAALLSTALSATTAFAQTADPAAQEAAPDDDSIKEIVVTAQKREQNLQDVPIAINAIGNEKLDQLQVSELQDVVKFLPSVTIQQGGPGFAQEKRPPAFAQGRKVRDPVGQKPRARYLFAAQASSSGHSP